MTFDTKIFQSRLAKRVFGFFALSALIPLLVALLLSFNHVTSQLTDQSRMALRDASKNYGMALYEKLLTAETQLNELANGLRDTDSLAPIARAGSRFASLTLIDAADAAHSLAGVLLDEQRVLASVPAPSRNETALWELPMAGHQQRIFMARPLDTDAPGNGMLVGELDPSYIWGDPATYPRSLHFCVVNSQQAPLHCSDAVPSAVFTNASAFASPTSGLAWHHAEHEYLGQYWSLFLSAHFTPPQWTVVAFQRKSDALQALTGFKLIYVSIVLVTVCLVALLSAVQLRRSLVPLGRLVDTTRRIAKRDFTSRVVIDSGDEFEELAGSVNTMAERLGKQFRALTTLSEVDRSILSSFDIDPVVQLALARLPEIVDCDCLAISLFDRDAPNVGSVYYQDCRHSRQDFIKRVRVSPEAIQQLISINKKILHVSGKSVAGYLMPLQKWGAKHFAVLPVVVNDRLGALISLGYRKRAHKDADALATALDFADRMAVAVAAVEREEKLYHQAHYDSLTALPNRQLFKDRLEQELLRARRSAHKLALLFVDLDHFKNVNDSRGHSVGDKLLQQAAGRLSISVREADTVSRLGGDEFTIIAPDLTTTQTAAALGRRILDEFSRPFDLEGQAHFVTASIGIAIFPVDGSTCEELLRNADTAMYRAKDMGRAHFSFFRRSMNTAALRKIELESQLRQALANEEFVLHYQPVVDLSSNDIVGAEALIRWEHPDRGLVPPAEFILLAEAIGLIESIGAWVLRTACQQHLSWCESGHPLQRVAVNVSPRQLLSQDFVETVRTTLAELDMPPECLELEITEAVLVSDAMRAEATIAELKSMGLAIAIDDFGTGYSSLSYLNRLPVNTLKIDRSFVQHVTTDQGSQAIVTAIMGIAASLERVVVAEGIESEEQAAFLKKQRCDRGQGNHYSPPMCAAQFAEWLANWTEGHATHGQAAATMAGVRR